jgi:hypothetical protein
MPGKRARPVRREAARKRTPAYGAPRCAAHPSQTGKGQTGLDQHQCRTWTSWYRWTTLVLLAHAFLVTVTVTARASPVPAGLIPLTLNEIRHLYNALVITPAANVRHILRSSYWRRRHQYRAQHAHYQRQSLRKP